MSTRGRGRTKNKMVVHDKTNNANGNNTHKYILNVTLIDDPT